MVRVRALKAADRADWQQAVADVERGISYPLGDDRFEIDHGEDYWAFFDRLGTTTTWIAHDGPRVLGTLTTVLRRVSPGAGRPARKAWYVCDLKVRREDRGRGVAARMMFGAFPWSVVQCHIGYAISMNPADKPANPIIEMAERFPLTPVSAAGGLVLFSLDADAMRSLAPLVEAHRGPLSYLSLAGRKDIVLQSTGEPMPLLHVQFGPFAEQGHSEPVAGHVHMFCVPEGDPLLDAVLATGAQPSATASIARGGMADQDWSFVLTSDI